MANESFTAVTPEGNTSNKFARCTRKHIHPIVRYATDINESDNIVWPPCIFGSDVIGEDTIPENQLLQIRVDGCPYEPSTLGSDPLANGVNHVTPPSQTESRKCSEPNLRPISPRKKLTTSTSVSSALLKKRELSVSATDLSELTENVRKIGEEIIAIRLSIEDLTAEIQSFQQQSVSSELPVLKPVLKKVKFVETPQTIEDLLKFKLECKGRVYEVIYDARCQRTVVGPAHVDENQIRKLAVRERVKIYLPGKAQPLLAIGEVATAVFKLPTATFTINVAVNRERNTTVVLGKDFGQKFIIGVNTEHRILTLKDDEGVPTAISFELYMSE